MKIPAALGSPDLLAIFPIFYIPLVILTITHDQFELPKITFLTLTAVLMALFLLAKSASQSPSPLSIALALFFSTQVLASLPFTSLSWRISLLGDYDNFCGLATLSVLMVLFLFYGRFLSLALFEKLVFFNNLTALLSSFYALAQHFGWDLTPWNPGSVNPSREFAALGNPNFLSAYLAISLPLYLGWCLKNGNDGTRTNEWSIFAWSGMFTGSVILFISTPNFAEHFGSFWNITATFPIRGIGLVLLSLGLGSILRSAGPWVLAGGTTFLLLGLVSTGSRGGFLGALAGTLLWTGLVLLNGEQRQKIRAKIGSIHPALLGTAGLLLVAVVVTVGYGFFVRLGQSLSGIHQSFADSRLSIWGPAWRMALAHPWTGVGLDTFKIAFPAYSGTDFNHTDGLFVSSRTAHDLWLQLLSTTGFLGALSYLLLLTAWGWMGIRCYQRGISEEKHWLSVVFAGGLAYQVQALFSFDVAALDLLWFLGLAFVQNLHTKQTEDHFKQNAFFSLGSWAKRIFLGLFVIVGLYFPISRLGADLAFARGEAASQALTQLPNTTELSTALAYSEYEITHLKKAAVLCPLEVKYRLYLGLAYEQRSQLDPSVRKGFLILAEDQYEEALGMSPSNSYYYNDLGRVRTSLGAFDPSAFEGAEEAYGRTCELDPANPLFRLNWSDSLLKVGKKKDARLQEQKAYDLDPLFTAKFTAQKALDLYRQGEHPAAFSSLETVVSKAPQSPEAWFCLGVLKLSDGKKKEALAALEKTRDLKPTAEKNPTIQNLDALIEQAEK